MSKIRLEQTTSWGQAGDEYQGAGRKSSGKIADGTQNPAIGCNAPQSTFP